MAPPAITTGVGPAGRKVVHFQATQHSEDGFARPVAHGAAEDADIPIDPALLRGERADGTEGLAGAMALTGKTHGDESEVLLRDDAPHQSQFDMDGF